MGVCLFQYKAIPVVAVLMGLAGWAVNAHADAKTQFYHEKNFVRNVFDDQPEELAGERGLEYFPVQRKKKQEEDEQPQVPVAQPSVAAEETDEDFSVRVAPASDEDVVDQFGDPNERMPVLAQPDAPRPFQGLQAALELGNEELAFDYARQYVRYMHDIQERSTAISELIRKANVAERISDDDAEVRSLEEVREFEEHLKEQERALPAEARAVLEEAKLFESLESQRRKEREQAKKELERLVAEGKLTVDPNGSVALYFVLDPSDPASVEPGKIVQQIFRESGKDTALAIMGLTLEDALSAEALRRFRAATGAQYPVQPGKRLLEAMGVREAPLFLFVSQTTGKHFIARDNMTRAMADEVIRFMKGKKQ